MVFSISLSAISFPSFITASCLSPFTFGYWKSMYGRYRFLGDKVLLKQSKDGLRATSDSVLAAALVPIKEGESILDVGAGNGVIGCCLNARIPCIITAIETQSDLCSLIQENADLLAEVQRLRMENEYLKKLNALVQEREKSEKKIK